jgi:quinohemoprotein ethanol dehydrogenase
MRTGAAKKTWLAALAVTALALTGCKPGASPSGESAALLADSSPGDDWAGYGRTNGQQHYSPLSDIGQANAADLGLAWSMDLPSGNSVTQPIAVGGVLYFATGLSVVHAVDAVTGKELWQYDPQAAQASGLNLRVGWGVRGVAWWNGRIYAGTQDGRLIALDARTGKLAWSAKTLRPEDAAHVNGAPRVFNGRVLIGFAGTTGAMRGYVTAYDAGTGKQLWRFWTVPGDPSRPFENRAMEMAARTWSGEWWKYGGGAMVWNSMAHDPETDTIFIGTGSPYPWSHRLRSAGKGDNLFVSSIVALDGRTGEYKWHYQTTPGDTWDFDAIMDIELADIEIGGKLRKVLLQAPKNGFFYVIDRITGEFISAEPYVEVTWASHVDPKSGRPVEIPGARFEGGRKVRIAPTSIGGHNWMSMAFSPQTGLAYIPANHFEADYSDVAHQWKPTTDRSVDGGVMIAGGPPFGMKPATGSLLAFSPVTGKKVWEIPHPTYLNGGVLATAGKLVFQGTVDGWFKAYAADSGKLVWQFDTGAPILSSPISYRAGGTQYVTLLTGSSMGIAMFAPAMSQDVERYPIDPMTQARRVLTFAIGGKAGLAPRRQPAAPPADPGFTPEPARMQAGYIAYETYCLACHGDSAVGIGQGPDLRRSAIAQDKAAFDAIVRGGTLEPRGMPRFAEFSDTRLEDIRHYIRARTAQLRGDAAGKETPAARPKSLSW